MGILGEVATLNSVKVSALCAFRKKSIIIRSRGVIWLSTSAVPICTLVFGLMALVLGFSALASTGKVVMPAAIFGMFLTMLSIWILATRHLNPEVYILNRSDKSIIRRIRLFGKRWESNTHNNDLSAVAIACYPYSQRGYHFYSLVIVKKDGSQLNVTGKFWDEELHALKNLAKKVSLALGIEYCKTDESIYHLKIDCSDNKNPKILFQPDSIKDVILRWWWITIGFALYIILDR